MAGAEIVLERIRKFASTVVAARILRLVSHRALRSWTVAGLYAYLCLILDILSTF